MTSRTGTERGEERRGGFTLTELLVVIAIIMMLAAATVPAIAAFRRGQRLEHAMRLVQSALNDARRLAITKHARHVVVFYSYEEKTGDPQSIRHAVRVYQEPTGIPPGPNIPPAVSRGYFTGDYIGQTLRLPAGTRFRQDRMECKLHTAPDADGPDKNLPIFERSLRGARSEVLAFRRDGTIEERNDIAATDNGARVNIYLQDEGYFQVPEVQRADIVITETTANGDEIKTAGKARRSLLDVNLTTGRTLGRVFEIGGSAPEKVGGQP